MAEPIVLELQRLASDKSEDADDLLRKALIVATKLGVTDFRTWVNNELHGYDNADDIPKYRRVQVELRVINTIQGRMIPLVLPVELDKYFRARPVTQPIGPMAELLRSSATTFAIPLSGEERQFLLSGQGGFPMEPVMSASRTHVTRIIDAVRNTILEWALQLEAEGILGAGMTFSPEEKQKAASSTNIHIGNFTGNFQGVLGDASHSEVTQRLQMTIAGGDFESLRESLRSKGISDTDVEHLRTAIAADPKPAKSRAFGSAVSGWVGGMVAKAATGTWDISVGAAGNFLGDAIAAYYGF